MQRKIQQKEIMQPNRQSGFTLFEIGLAVAIVCLLATVTVMGQDFTISSQVNRLERDFRSIQNAVYDSQDGARSTQGNFHKVSLHLPDAADSANNPNASWSSTSGEIFKVWQYVRQHGLAQNPGETSPHVRGPLKLPGGSIGVTETDSTLIIGLTGNFTICTSNISGRLVKKLDVVMDDGNTASGSMRVTRSMGGAAVVTDDIVNSATYMVCMGI